MLLLCLLFCLISIGITVDIRYPDLAYLDDSKNDMESITAIPDYNRQ